MKLFVQCKSFDCEASVGNVKTIQELNSTNLHMNAIIRYLLCLLVYLQDLYSLIFTIVYDLHTALYIINTTHVQLFICI